MAGPVFFKETTNTRSEMTALYDFVWPTAVAMWNLRWQVHGYLSIRPNASIDELHGRFSVGSEIHGGNLIRACSTHSWENQQEVFAKILLINICALYESWLSSVLDQLGGHAHDELKCLQFPTKYDSKSAPADGVWASIAKICRSPSTFTSTCFYPVLLKNPKNSKTQLDALLKCYRFFKECRNDVAHNGSKASARTAKAFVEFQPVANTNDLGVLEVPLHKPLTLGQPVNLNLRGVVGLSDIVLRIITTLDAELACSQSAEKVFITRWQATHDKTKFTLPVKDVRKRQSRAVSLIKKTGLPEPVVATKAIAFLQAHSLVI